MGEARALRSPRGDGSLLPRSALTRVLLRTRPTEPIKIMGMEERNGVDLPLVFLPSSQGVIQSQRRSFTPLYVGSFQCLSISIHTFLGFVLGEPDIFLKKGGEPLTVWTVLLPRGFAPNSCVRPLRHHSGPLSVSSSRSSSHHCGSLGDVMCTLFSQTGHPASTPPRRTG